MRRVLIAVLACAALLTAAASASAHAVRVASDPEADAILDAAPPAVRITFSEPVQLVDDGDADVVDGEGQPASAGPAQPGRDRSVLLIPLRANLGDGTYTVRYSVVGADSHVVPGVFVFGVGVDELADPVLSGAERGPSETGAWGVSSRFLEIVGLGGLLGLIAFRWLVWAPAVRGGTRPAADGAAVLGWGRDVFWVAFGALAVGAMLAEGYLLVVQSASLLGVGVGTAIGDAEGISQVLGATRFGSLVQLRGALLFALFALGCVLFLREYGGGSQPRPATPAGSPVPAVVMAALLGSVLGGVAVQGHASVTDLPALQVGAQLVHIAAVAIWITGLALVVVVHLRLPRVAPQAGPAVAARVLARFSGVALIAVGVAIATGVVRSVGELSDPAELWETAYGRSIVIKLALLVPIGAIALYNRRIVAALARVPRPNAATLRRVRRTASAELALSIVVVAVATLLVAQVPGAS